MGVTVVLTGDDIDPTGGDDSAGGVQSRIDAAPDGAVIVVPAGAVLRCTRTVTLHGTGKTLQGPGELRFAGGDAAESALRVTGSRCRVQTLTVSNPDELFVRGVEIAAHDVTVTDCVVDRFRYGIVVAADGEWLDTRILGNRVLNVLGAGGGRGSDSREGEDRGDGITVWGARATIVGNVVSALPGTDARIGIHAEGLRDVKEESPPHSDAMVTISGNVVTGPFRRSIVFEDLDNGTITGNTVADATWWGIALINGTGCLVADNAIRYTRTAEDDQGSAYSPTRTAVLVFAGAGHTVSGNTVTVHGAAEAFITVFTLLEVQPTDIAVTGNNCRTVDDGVCDSGIIMLGQPGPVRPKISGNTLVGVTDTGIYLGAATAPEVSGNTLVAAPGGTRGVFGDSPLNTAALVVGNRVSGFGTGIGLFAQSAGVVSANVVQDCPVAVDLFSSSGVVVTGNAFPGSSAQLQNPGSNAVLP